MRDTKWFYFYLKDPIQLQTWLEDLSLEGWQLEKVRGDWEKFRRIPPHRIRYRLEPKSVTPDMSDEDVRLKDQLYREMGWERVPKSNLFRAEDPNTPELYTDPETLMHQWKRSLRDFLVATAICLLLGIAVEATLLGRIYGFGIFSRVDYLFRTTWGQVLYGAAFLLLMVLDIWQSWKEWRFYRQMEAGKQEPYSPYPTSRWSRWRPMLVSVLLRLLCLLMPLLLYPSLGWYEAYHDLGDLEVPLYMDVETLGGRGAVSSELAAVGKANATTLGWSTVFQYCDDPAANWERGETGYYHMRGGYLARLAVERLLEETKTTEAEPLNLSGADEAWTGEDWRGDPFLLVRRGNQVLKTSCDGDLEIWEQGEAALALLDVAQG